MRFAKIGGCTSRDGRHSATCEYCCDKSKGDAHIGGKSIAGGLVGQEGRD